MNSFNLKWPWFKISQMFQSFWKNTSSSCIMKPVTRKQATLCASYMTNRNRHEGTRRVRNNNMSTFGLSRVKGHIFSGPSPHQKQFSVSSRMDQVWVQLLLQISRLEELDWKQEGLWEDESRSGDHNQPKGAGEGLLNPDCSSGFDQIITVKTSSDSFQNQIYLQGINLRQFSFRLVTYCRLAKHQSWQIHMWDSFGISDAQWALWRPVVKR